MAYKNAFIDLDGTMLNDLGKLTPNTLAALDKLVKENIGITITTGRWPISSFVLNEQVEKYTSTKNNYLISLNGALTYDLNTKEIISSFKIREDLFDKLVQIAKRFRVVMLVYTEDGIKKNESFGYKIPFKWAFKFYNGGKIRKLNLKTFDGKDDALKILFIAINKRKLEKLYVWLKDNMSDYLQFVKVSPLAIEITSLDSTKGNAVKNLCKVMKIKQEEAICFGDSNNDVSMFKEIKKGMAINPSSLKTINLADKTFYDKKAFANSINDYLLADNKNVVINIDDIDYNFEDEKFIEICKEYNDFDFYFYTQKPVNEVVKSKSFKKIENIEKYAIIIGEDFILNQDQQILFSKFIDNNVIPRLSKMLKKNKVHQIDAQIFRKSKSKFKELRSKKMTFNKLKVHVNIAYFSFQFKSQLDASVFNHDGYDVNKKDDVITITSKETSHLIDGINNKQTIIFSKEKINLLTNATYKK